MYAKVSITHMLHGHAYSRAIRAHSLTQLALAILLIRKSNLLSSALSEELHALQKQIVSNNCNIEEIFQSEILFTFNDKFQSLLDSIANECRTSRLWVQYIRQVSLIRRFILAERTGNWNLHINTIIEMLPYFHAAAHLPYAKSAHLYCQLMLDLPNKFSPREYERFTSLGFFTVRRSERFWSGIWTDLTIEQTLMRTMKVSGGLTQGRGITESTLTQWVATAPACMAINEAINSFAGLSVGTTDQHVDLRDSRKH